MNHPIIHVLCWYNRHSHTQARTYPGLHAHTHIHHTLRASLLRVNKIIPSVLMNACWIMNVRSHSGKVVTIIIILTLFPSCCSKSMIDWESFCLMLNSLLTKREGLRLEPWQQQLSWKNLVMWLSFPLFLLLWFCSAYGVWQWLSNAWKFPLKMNWCHKK